MQRQTPKKAAANKVVVKKAANRKVVVKKAAVKKAVARATKASAKLENREVPAGYARPAAISGYIATPAVGGSIPSAPTRIGPGLGHTQATQVLPDNPRCAGHVPMEFEQRIELSVPDVAGSPTRSKVSTCGRTQCDQSRVQQGS